MIERYALGVLLVLQGCQDTPDQQECQPGGAQFAVPRQPVYLPQANDTLSQGTEDGLWCPEPEPCHCAQAQPTTNVPPACDDAQQQNCPVCDIPDVGCSDCPTCPVCEAPVACPVPQCPNMDPGDVAELEVPAKTCPVGYVLSQDLCWMIKEVSLAQYSACQLKDCSPPELGWWVASLDVCNSSPNKPADCLSANDAKAYCAWVGARLPTTDEVHAVMTNGGVTSFPWGDAVPSCSFAVIKESEAQGAGCGLKQTANPCSKPMGLSLDGICDLVGNVWEYVEDGHMCGADIVMSFMNDVSAAGLWPAGSAPESNYCTNGPYVYPDKDYFGAGVRCVLEPGPQEIQ